MPEVNPLAHPVDYVKFEPFPIAARDGRAIGSGSLGGKARGLIFAEQVLGRANDPLLSSIEIPESWFVATGVFDEFMAENGLDSVRPSTMQFGEIEKMFSVTRLPADFRKCLESLLETVRYPLAIRSSSLIEDNVKYSCAGKYLTTFIPNSGSAASRMDQITNAIRQVYASTYGPNALAYKMKHGLRGDKMGVIVQRLVGKARGGHFYHEIAGVAYSKTYRRWSERIRREDGVIRFVFGLGTRCTGRGYARTMSLTNSGLRPEGHNPFEIAKYSQETFDALDMTSGNVKSYNINHRPETVSFHPNARRFIQIYSSAEDMLRDMGFSGATAAGERMVFSFNKLNRQYPQLLSRLDNLVRVLESEMGMPVDIEFAYESEDDLLSLIQARPLTSLEEYSKVSIPAGLREDDILLRGDRMLVDGKLEGTKWLIYVDPYEYEKTPEKPAVARAIGRINDELRGERYILIGPGRWGSTNPNLGVPVRYSEISNAGLLVELGILKAGFAPELSYGTHFFADLEVDRVLYLPVFDGLKSNIYRTDWFSSAEFSLPYHPAVRVYRGRFSAYLDGDTNSGVVIKAG